MTPYQRRLLRSDSPSIVNYALSTSSRLTSPQRALMSLLSSRGGELALDDCHAAVLAGLVRRGLVEIDETHARLVKR